MGLGLVVAVMDGGAALARAVQRRSPRVQAMIVLLLEHGDDIDRLTVGSAEFHCSSGRVVLKVNGTVGERKVDS